MPRRWITTWKLNAFLQFNEQELLNHPSKVSRAIAKEFTESEFEKYRIVQDRLFESDFDQFARLIEMDGENE